MSGTIVGREDLTYNRDSNLFQKCSGEVSVQVIYVLPRQFGQSCFYEADFVHRRSVRLEQKRIFPKAVVTKSGSCFSCKMGAGDHVQLYINDHGVHSFYDTELICLWQLKEV